MGRGSGSLPHTLFLKTVCGSPTRRSFLKASVWFYMSPRCLALVQLQRWDPVLSRAPAPVFCFPHPILLPRTVTLCPVVSHTRTPRPVWSQRPSAVLVACLLFLLASSRGSPLRIPRPLSPLDSCVNLCHVDRISDGHI